MLFLVAGGRGAEVTVLLEECIRLDKNEYSVIRLCASNNIICPLLFASPFYTNKKSGANGSAFLKHNLLYLYVILLKPHGLVLVFCLINRNYDTHNLNY